MTDKRSAAGELADKRSAAGEDSPRPSSKNIKQQDSHDAFLGWHKEKNVNLSCAIAYYSAHQS